MPESGILRLPPPPRPSHSEFWPISIPPYRDDPSPPWQEDIQAWEAMESHPTVLGLTEDLLRKAQQTALRNGVVKHLLLNKRYIPIGASLRNTSDRHKGAEHLVLFLFYNYTDDLTAEVWLDHDCQQVVRVIQVRYQPPAVDEEIEQAIRLAREDPRLADHLSDALEGTAILVQAIDCYDHSATIPYYYHRLFEVRFGPPEERPPLYFALVDLSVEIVIQVKLLNPAIQL